MSLSDSQAERLYGLTADQIDQLALRTYEQVVRQIRAGMSPQDAIGAALRGFEGPYYQIVSDALSKVLGQQLGVAVLRKLPVGEITLSDKLYAGAKQTAATARRVIQDHARFEHDARKLALELFEGYGFRDDEPVEPVVKLPRYMRDLDLEKETELLLRRIQAGKIKSGPLRASYLQALDAILEGKGQAARDRALKVAVYEKHRYFANRIAQTELHRAQSDTRAKELMDFEELEVVEVRLSKSHPEPDICDLYAKQDKYGLGPGLYPKQHAPKPPFHPFCRCLMRPRIDLVDVRMGRVRNGAGSAYLRSLDPDVAARVAGSRTKRDAILSGRSVESVIDAGKPSQYRTRMLSGRAMSRGSSKSPVKVSNEDLPQVKEPEFQAQQTSTGAAKWAMEQRIVDHADYSGVKPDVANEMNQSLFYHVQKFPELRTNQKFIGSGQAQNTRWRELRIEEMLEQVRARAKANGLDPDDPIWRRQVERRVKPLKMSSKVYAHSWAAKDVSGIAVNKKWGGDPKRFTDALKSDVSTGWHPDGTASVKAVFDHEFAHQLDDLLLLDRDAELRKLWDAFSGSDGADLSRYARKNIKEMIAEGWAEYLNNPKVRKLAKQIGEIVEQRYKEKFDG